MRGPSVPTIDTPLLIDLLLGLVILLFVPFGIRRGAAKEAMVSAGILFGALVAATWADRGGAELAARFGLDAQIAPFAVAMAALGGGAFLLGYGGGAALGHVPQGWLSHLVGGLLAMLNGALVLTYLLTFLAEYLQPPRALDDGVVAEALIQRFDLLQLAAGGGLILLVGLGLAVSAVRQRSQPRPALPVASRQRPVRVARDGDAGKYEPGPMATTGLGAHQATLDQTAPLLERPRRPWDEQAPATNGSYPVWSTNPATNGQSGQPDAGDLWERRSAAASWSAAGSPAGGQAAYEYGDAADADGTRCASCNAAVGARDLFCPSCGKTV